MILSSSLAACGPDLTLNSFVDLGLISNAKVASSFLSEIPIPWDFFVCLGEGKSVGVGKRVDVRLLIPGDDMMVNKFGLHFCAFFFSL